MQVVIIDDEKNSIEYLTELLKNLLWLGHFLIPERGWHIY